MGWVLVLSGCTSGSPTLFAEQWACSYSMGISALCKCSAPSTSSSDSLTYQSHRCFCLTAIKIVGARLYGLSPAPTTPLTFAENILYSYSRCLRTFSFSPFDPQLRKESKRRANSWGGGEEGRTTDRRGEDVWKHVRGQRGFLSVHGATVRLLSWDKDCCDTAVARTRSDWVHVLHVHSCSAITLWTTPMTRGNWICELNESLNPFVGGGFPCTVCKD